MPRSPQTAHRTIDCIFGPARSGWRAISIALALVGALLVGSTSPSVTVALARQATPAGPISMDDATASLAAASAWLREKQDSSGGFAGLSGGLDAGTTTDAAMALYAAEASDADAAAALAAVIAFLDSNGGEYAATGPGQAAKLALAAITGGRDPRDFAGKDLVAAMTAPLATPTAEAPPGIYGDDLYDHALVLIALSAAGEPAPACAIEPLRAAQGASGGWAYDGASDPGAADSNTTALIVQALVASDHGDDPMVTRALAFLRSLIAPDGGFAYGPADPLVADANSTALAIQALIAAGQNPSAPEWGSALAALARFQTPSGGFRYMRGDAVPNLLATLQAMPALARLPLPVAHAGHGGGSVGTVSCVALAPAA